MTSTEIRAALHAVERAVDVPPVDQVAFRARVRGERRRRTAGRALAGVAAGATLVAGGLTARAVLDEPERTPVATPGAVDHPLSETVFFVLEGRLTALDPDGVLHDVGVDAESVAGWTAERVYVSDGGHLSVRRTSPPFDEVESPVQGPVQSPVLSGDGRYLAWIGDDGRVHRHDLKAGKEDLVLPVGPNTALTGVSADGVLVAEPGSLTLRGKGRSIAVPIQNDGFSVASNVGGDVVVVNDRNGRTLLYDASEGPMARPIDSFLGFGVAGPYGERVAVIAPGTLPRGGGARVEVWDGGTRLPSQGLDGEVPDTVRWADETTLLVAVHDADGAGLYACDIDLDCDRLPVDGEVGLGS